MERPGISIDIEKAIEEILKIPVKRDVEDDVPCTEDMPKKKKGRPKVQRKIPIWAVSYEGESPGRTIALISMCIKDDMNQSLFSLAEKVSEMKRRPVSECLAVLRDLKKRGMLGYYSSDLSLIRWEPGKENADVHRKCENSGE